MCQLCLEDADQRGITMFAWAGNIKSYQMLSGYNTSGGQRTWFDLDPVEDQPGAEDVDIKVHFGDHEVGPGATFGHVSSLPGGGSRIEVELPRDWLHTFWRAIGDVQDQDCLLVITANDEDVIISFGVVVSKGFGGETDQSRRERLDSMRRQFDAANGS
jgi:hypothetical protein